MNITDIRHDWIITREKKQLDRYCLICGKKFTTTSPTTSCCSEECSESLAKDMNREAYGIFLEAVPEALSVLGYETAGDYIDARDNPKEFVYFIRAGNSVKIGYAKDVSKRIKALQTGNQVKLELIGYVPGTIQDEAGLHIMFDDYRLHGEWFEYSDEIKQHIAGLDLIAGKEQA